MKKTVFEQQSEFLTAADVAHPIQDEKVLGNAYDQVTDEMEEWSVEDCFANNPRLNLNDLKECIDVLYTAAQYLNKAVGPEKADELFAAVHANNMEKCVDGKIVKSPEGKILKPTGFNKYNWINDFKKILGQA